jgi:hypothetical protein
MVSIGLSKFCVLVVASKRKRSIKSLALVRVIESLVVYVNHSMAVKIGTTRMTNSNTMLGRRRMFEYFVIVQGAAMRSDKFEQLANSNLILH